MKCYIKSSKYDVYFQKHLFEGQNHYVYKNDAKLFKSVKEARDTIKKYKIKKYEIVKG